VASCLRRVPTANAADPAYWGTPDAGFGDAY
jgi:hypothetical protein